MHFTGIGSMLTAQFRPGPIHRPTPASPAEEGVRELFFFDMLEAGIYLARRGMVALSLPVGEAELDRYGQAVAEFVRSREPLLREAGA